MLMPVTRKITDESKDGKYQFTFYCDICGKPQQSPVYDSLTGSHTGCERRQNAEHDAAYERANNEMLRCFNRCPKCGKVVCDECFDIMGDTDECVECAKTRSNKMVRGGMKNSVYL